MPSLRHQARSLAVQILYQAEVLPPGGQGGGENPGQSTAAMLERFWQSNKASPKARQFAGALASQTLHGLEATDAALRTALEEWRLERLPVPVRAILRLAACELLQLRETPRGVIINEAVELTRDFVDEESARFVNAVLDKLPDTGGDAGHE